MNVSTRRNTNVHIRLFPVPVQGKGAETLIADAIRIMNVKKLADVLIIARGGRKYRRFVAIQWRNYSQSHI